MSAGEDERAEPEPSEVLLDQAVEALEAVPVAMPDERPSEPMLAFYEIEALEPDEAAPPNKRPRPRSPIVRPSSSAPRPDPEPVSTPDPPADPSPRPDPDTLRITSRVPEPGTPTPVRHTATASIVRLLRPNAAVILLGLVFVLAMLEIFAAFLSYREQIDDEEWDELAVALEAQPDAPLMIASEWLAPRARMELAQARTWDSVAPPDLRGMEHFWLLTHGREGWPPALKAELEDLPEPDLIAIHEIGPLALREYYQPRAGTLVWSLLEQEPTITTDAGKCSGGGTRWSCKDGRAQIRVLEVDYRPRRCVALELDSGVRAKIDLGKLELGNRLRGHVGFADFNARLRADPTVMLEAWIDGEVAARWLFTDDQGWAPFALRTPAGKHRVELRVTSSAAGTWQREGHRPLPTDTLCLEARSFEEEEPAAEEATP